MSGTFSWLSYVSVLNAYEPQRLVSGSPEAWQTLLLYDGVLIGVGICGFIAGTLIFSRRDLPAPL